MTEPIRKLVVGVATLTDMDPVIPSAAALGARANLPLDVVHAFDVSDPFVDTYLHTSIVPGDPLKRYCEGLQARLEGQVGGLSGRGEVHCRAVPGTPPEVLREAASDSHSLLLVGPTHHWRSTAALLGTTAQRVLHGAGSPVLVLRGDLPQPPRVLFAIDLASPDAAAVVERGLAIIASLVKQQPIKRRIIVVVRLEMDLQIPGLHEKVVEAATTRLQTFVADLPDGDEFEFGVRIGSPGKEIVADAAERSAELIVVGTHARTGVSRAILGSVAESVVRDASCSVLVIPPERK